MKIKQPFLLILAALMVTSQAVAQLQVGSAVELVSRESNYHLFVGSSGTDRVPGANGSYGETREAVIVGELADGRWQVRVEADERLIGGVTGWVNEANVVLAGESPQPETHEVPYLRLMWSSNSTNEDGFRIERSADGIEFAQIGETPKGVVTYVDEGLPHEATLWYRVYAYNKAGKSGYSNLAFGTTPAPPASPPEDPEQLSLELILQVVVTRNPDGTWSVTEVKAPTP